MNFIEKLFGIDSILFKWLIDGTPEFNQFGEILCIINIVIMTIFAIMYFQQMIWMLISVFFKKHYKETDINHKFGYIVAARNEEEVIAQIINSILAQDYPKDCMKIFIIADNCNDRTAAIASELGAIVYERFDQEKRGKSYALDYLFKKIHEDQLDKELDGYIIFDADNLVDKNFTKEINKVYASGGRVITSYRNATNPCENLWAFGSAYSFLRECDLLHRGRAVVNKSAYISGTGFLIDKQIIIQRDGWAQHCMIEDIEFTISYILENQKVYYCHDAIFYDQQPITFKDSWNQRMRWVKGLYQCLFGYAGALSKKLFSFKRKNGDKMDIYEILLFTLPIPIITIGWLCIYNIIMFINFLSGGCNLIYFLQTSVSTGIDFMLTSYLYCLFMCILISIKNWKRLKARPIKKILMPFIFFFFVITYIPMLAIAPFKKIEWKPIKHTTSKID